MKHCPVDTSIREMSKTLTRLRLVNFIRGICSPVSAGSRSDSSVPDGRDTCERSPAASRARISLSQEKAQDSTVRGLVCGGRCTGSFAAWDRTSLSWKTSQRSLFGGWTLFSDRWPRSGTTRNGTAFRLPTLAHLTAATGSGLLHTPTAKGNQGCPSMTDGRYPGQWPTPSAQQFEQTPEAIVKRLAVEAAKKRNGNGFGLTTANAVAMAEAGRATQHDKNSRPLNEQIVGPGHGEQTRPTTLNPAWVSLLMGYPLWWVEVE